MNQSNFAKRSLLSDMRVTMVTQGIRVELLALLLVTREKPSLADGLAPERAPLSSDHPRPAIMNVQREEDAVLEVISM